ncbi:hypothetical protein ACN38_g4639 [Penicillium nordicum]|uniref:Uncharacterized protein n=1 Tax=Penicillium nordicum TaxID=229535 RepID=A0A0M8P338_9EURO|nr:hypothetical protein ACN38_g4639 [Penicillium nordicum]
METAGRAERQTAMRQVFADLIAQMVSWQYQAWGPLQVVGIHSRCGLLRLRRDHGHEPSMLPTPVHALEPSLREAHLTLSVHMLMYVHLYPAPSSLARPARLPCDHGPQKD